MTATTANQLHFEALRPDDHIKVTRRMKVGMKIWYTSTSGRVIRTERRRNGLHVERNVDDKAFQDLILMLKDGTPTEETTISMDEFTVLESLPG